MNDRIIINVGKRLCGHAIPIGRVGENIVSEIEWNIGAWREQYGDGTLELLVQRNGDTNPYPVALTIDGNSAVWVITDTDTAVNGRGQLQLIYRIGDAVKKSVIYEFICRISLGATGPIPDGYSDWLDALSKMAARVETAAQSITDKVGNLQDLVTKDKSSAVAAINELAKNVGSNVLVATAEIDGYLDATESQKITLDKTYDELSECIRGGGTVVFAIIAHDDNLYAVEFLLADSYMSLGSNGLMNATRTKWVRKNEKQIIISDLIVSMKFIDGAVDAVFRTEEVLVNRSEAAVESINGKFGAVTISAEDVGAISAADYQNKIDTLWTDYQSAFVALGGE